METPLDIAHRAQAAEPEDPGLRLRFHERVLDAELLLVLAEPAAERLVPEVVELEAGRFVLAFDRDERLAGFLEAPAPFAVLSGRRLAAMLAGQGIGIALNLGAESGTLLPAEAVDWMAAVGARPPAAAAARLREVARPEPAPALVAALGPKLVAMAAVVEEAYLVAAGFEDGRSGLLLALAGVPEAAREGVAAAVAEAVGLSGAPAGLDVTFVEPGGPGSDAIARVGLRLALPEAPAPAGPGMDPDRPPPLGSGRSGS
jgi:hypothetical protein